MCGRNTSAGAACVDHLLQRLHEGIGRVVAERGMIDGDHFAGSCASSAATAPTPWPATAILIGIDRQLLRRRDRLQAGAIELAVLLFRDDENHRTRASSRSRLTSSFAASAAEPPIITVCLAFCGA